MWYFGNTNEFRYSMRLGIGLLRSPNVTQLEFEIITLYVGYCCRWYREDDLWMEESRCPYRVECIDRFESLVQLEIKPIRKKQKGGNMVIKRATVKLFTVRDVAEILNCKQSHVMRLIRSNALKAEKHGWVWAISSDDLEEYQKKDS